MRFTLAAIVIAADFTKAHLNVHVDPSPRLLRNGVETGGRRENMVQDIEPNISSSSSY